MTPFTGTAFAASASMTPTSPRQRCFWWRGAASSGFRAIRRFFPDSTEWLVTWFATTREVTTDGPGCWVASDRFDRLTKMIPSSTSCVARVAGGLIVALQTPGVLLENMDLERTPGMFEQMLAGYAGQIDPEGLAAECEQATAFAEGFKLGRSYVHSGQCAAFLAGFVDDFPASRGG